MQIICLELLIQQCKKLLSQLKNGRSEEAEPDCMPIKDILEFIPGTK